MSGTPTTPPSDGDPGTEISDHVNDYLEGLRARFEELSDRIDEASRVSIDRGRAELEELITSGRGGAPPITEADAEVDAGDTGIVGGAPTMPDGDDVATGDQAAVVSNEPQGWNTHADTPARSDADFQVGGATEPEWDPEFETSPIAARLRSMHAREAAAAADQVLDERFEAAEPEPLAYAASDAAPEHSADGDPEGAGTSSGSGTAMPRPVNRGGEGTRRWVIVGLVALVAVGAAFIAGRWWPSDADVATATTLPSRPAATAAPSQPSDASIAAAVESAVAALAPGTVTVTVEDGVVALAGTVADASARDALSTVALAIAGVRQLDNRVQVVGAAPPPTAEELQAAADAARTATGFDHLDVTVVDGVATITGVVAVESVGDGVFASIAPLRDALIEINGIERLVTRVQLRGDEAALRADLKDLIDEAPIIFASNSAELDGAAIESLDRAAEIIVSYPGLRVLIAGHTDAAGGTSQNEALAAARGQAVLGHLISKGVPVTRLQVVSYGELFPEAGAEQSLNRRIEFEVAP